jgi:uncharacterized protein (UPF0332 family)
MKPGAQALMQKASESLQAAELLRREGYLDFAASRAYYAMFYAAQALLLQREMSFSSHAAVIAAFGREFARTGELDPRLHRHLIDAQDFRNLGDYGVGTSLSSEDVQEVLEWTHDFLAAAGAFLSSRSA